VLSRHPVEMHKIDPYLSCFIRKDFLILSDRRRQASSPRFRSVQVYSVTKGHGTAHTYKITPIQCTHCRDPKCSTRVVQSLVAAYSHSKPDANTAYGLMDQVPQFRRVQGSFFFHLISQHFECGAT